MHPIFHNIPVFKMNRSPHPPTHNGRSRRVQNHPSTNSIQLLYKWNTQRRKPIKYIMKTVGWGHKKRQRFLRITMYSVVRYSKCARPSKLGKQGWTKMSKWGVDLRHCKIQSKYFYWKYQHERAAAIYTPSLQSCSASRNRAMCVNICQRWSTEKWTVALRNVDAFFTPWDQEENVCRPHWGRNCTPSTSPSEWGGREGVGCWTLPLNADCPLLWNSTQKNKTKQKPPPSLLVWEPLYLHNVLYTCFWMAPVCGLPAWLCYLCYVQRQDWKYAPVCIGSVHSDSG